MNKSRREVWAGCTVDPELFFLDYEKLLKLNKQLNTGLVNLQNTESERDRSPPTSLKCWAETNRLIRST